MKRFTPAYAGKIKRRGYARHPAGVHPRIRGEDSLLLWAIALGLGSPPHTRGRSSVFQTCTPHRRFTPAYAGKILAAFFHTTPDEVHPRIRGEDNHNKLLLFH